MAARVFIDQTIFAPTFIGCYLTINGILEGLDIDQIKRKLSEAYRPALEANYKVWPAIQCINFYFIPLNYQTLFVNSFGTLWNAYMSWLNKKAQSSVTQTSNPDLK